MAAAREAEERKLAEAAVAGSITETRRPPGKPLSFDVDFTPSEFPRSEEELLKRLRWAKEQETSCQMARS